ncbi:unnamed protein product [Gongylonema pulchrum]|uniref:Uncharacterized protein n=1 Tax=Gongylonema pulchrum TaxID=637853 RepID=A0A183DT09_9BILA|nr:unnamed protein product [Gongylonema pulchrum]
MVSTKEAGPEQGSQEQAHPEVLKKLRRGETGHVARPKKQRPKAAAAAPPPPPQPPPPSAQAPRPPPAQASRPPPASSAPPASSSPPTSSAEKREAARSVSLILNERPGVHYFCCDRFFRCGERCLIAREIWPSDGGSIELNRKELKRFILENEAKRYVRSEHGE